MGFYKLNKESGLVTKQLAMTAPTLIEDLSVLHRSGTEFAGVQFGSPCVLQRVCADETLETIALLGVL